MAAWLPWRFSPELEPNLRTFAAACGAATGPHLLLRQGEWGMRVEGVKEEEKQEGHPETGGDSSTGDTGELQAAVDALRERTLSGHELTALPMERLCMCVRESACDTTVLHLCYSLCDASLEVRTCLGVTVCRDLLLPWLQARPDTPIQRSTQQLLHHMLSVLPEDMCMHLLVPLICSPHTCHSVVSPLVGDLSPHYAGLVLRRFLSEDRPPLAAAQLSVVQGLVVAAEAGGDDTQLLVHLVLLLERSAWGLASSAAFGRLLLATVTRVSACAGARSSPSAREALSQCVRVHTSVMKGPAGRAVTALLGEQCG